MQLLVVQVPCHHLLLTAQLLSEIFLNRENTSVLLSPFNIEDPVLTTSQLSGGVWCLKSEASDSTRSHTFCMTSASQVRLAIAALHTASADSPVVASLSS